MLPTDNILDAVPPPPPPKDSTLYKWLRGIAVTAEIGIWLIGLIAFLFKLESWEGGSEMLILFTAMAGLFYFFFTFLVTGARGWQQILGAEVVGAALALLLFGKTFVVEAWEGGHEMRILGLLLGGISTVAILYFLIRAQSIGSNTRFHWNALVRLGIMLFLGS